MIHFDNAAGSFPKPNEVIKEVKRVLTNCSGVNGRGNYDGAKEANNILMFTRKSVCDFFDGDNPFQFAFVPSATYGLNMVIKGVLDKDDSVITTMGEHNSVLRPLKELNKSGISVFVVKTDENGCVDIESVENSIRENTKAIVFNYGNNVIGTLNDYKKIIDIAKKNKIITIADCAQSAGHLKISLKDMNVDFMVASGHKGLLGPPGVAIVYARDGQIFKTCIEGGTGTNSNSIENPKRMPEKLEVGTLNIPAISGLWKSLEYIDRIGIDNIHEKEKKLLNKLYRGLKEMDFIKIYGENSFKKERLPLISFNIRGKNPSQFGEYMDEEGVSIRTGYHCAPLIHQIIETESIGTIRVSLGYRNNKKEIDYFLEKVKGFYYNV